MNLLVGDSAHLGPSDLVTWGYRWSVSLQRAKWGGEGALDHLFRNQSRTVQHLLKAAVRVIHHCPRASWAASWHAEYIWSWICFTAEPLKVRRLHLLQTPHILHDAGGSSQRQIYLIIQHGRLLWSTVCVSRHKSTGCAWDSRSWALMFLLKKRGKRQRV